MSAKNRGRNVLASALVLLMVALVPESARAQRQNNYPIVLVHGFAGWGEDEMLGFRYWGGTVDLRQVMTDAGYTTYTGVVGPFSSNWDRACDLYAYIKGGRVDYGKAHSEAAGHDRFGKTFPGLYPSWGGTPGGQLNKVHLVAHSMGGQTARMLAQLLEEGSQAEREASPTDLNSLFAGGKPWVASISTIASPHDGTTAADKERPVVMTHLAQDLLLVAAVTAGCGDEPIFDFKLDQWGLKRKSGESFFSYADNVWKSSIWKNTTDLSVWDLSTDGALAANRWVRAQPDVYYFSYAFDATARGPVTGHRIPTTYMNPLFYGNAFWMGSFTRNESGRVVVDSSWWPNDGYVNTISERGPQWGSSDIIADYSGSPRIGVWNFMGTQVNVDHEAAIGRFMDVAQWYRDLATRLGALPVVNASARCRP